MEFKDDSFDTVVAAYVVTAVPDYRKVVSEMIRVCRPGGRIIMLNHFSNDNKAIAAIEKVLSPLTKHLRMADRPGAPDRAGRNAAACRPEAACESVAALGLGGMCEREERERQDTHQRREKRQRRRRRTHTSTAPVCRNRPADKRWANRLLKKPASFVLTSNILNVAFRRTSCLGSLGWAGRRGTPRPFTRCGLAERPF